MKLVTVLSWKSHNYLPIPTAKRLQPLLSPFLHGPRPLPLSHSEARRASGKRAFKVRIVVYSWSPFPQRGAPGEHRGQWKRFPLAPSISFFASFDFSLLCVPAFICVTLVLIIFPLLFPNMLFFLFFLPQPGTLKEPNPEGNMLE